MHSQAYEEGVLYSKHPTRWFGCASASLATSTILQVARVTSPSVLMATNALLGIPSKIQLKTATDCTYFWLDVHVVSETMQAFRGNLNASVSLVRAGFENPRENLKVPILDFHQVFQSDYSMLKQKPLLRLRHAILKIIHYIRIRRYKTANLSDLVLWLVRIAKSHGMSWARLRYQLQSRSLSKPLKNLVCVLKTETSRELGRPFSAMAQDSLFELCAINDKLAQFDAQLADLSGRNQAFESSLQEFTCLIAQLGRAVNC